MVIQISFFILVFACALYYSNNCAFTGLASLFPVPLKPSEDKPKFLSQAERAKFTIPSEKKEIIVGCILGDLYVEKQKGGLNARLKFSQGLVHEKYLLELYELFSEYCSASPQTYIPQPDKRTKQVYSLIYFKTYALPCFNPFLDLFYPNGKKIIPLNIGELLTPLGLAYWISDDGMWHKINNYVELSTYSFTQEEVELLINVLNSKWNLKCYICKHKSGYVIRIPAYSISILQSLLKDIMPLSMQHKIGL